MLYKSKKMAKFTIQLSKIGLFLCMFLIYSCSQKTISVNRGKGKPKIVHKNSNKSNSLKTKYAGILKVNERDISDIKLYSFVDSWLGVPYKYAGKSKSGVDCSGFSGILYQEVYNKNISGTTQTFTKISKKISKNNLKEGDFVFFNISGKKVSHMGVYLKNNKFVHASTKAGVIINDLDEPYYKKYFYSCGRP